MSIFSKGGRLFGHAHAAKQGTLGYVFVLVLCGTCRQTALKRGLMPGRKGIVGGDIGLVIIINKNGSILKFLVDTMYRLWIEIKELFLKTVAKLPIQNRATDCYLHRFSASHWIKLKIHPCGEFT